MRAEGGVTTSKETSGYTIWGACVGADGEVASQTYEAILVLTLSEQFHSSHAVLQSDRMD